jgi:monoamine oxidase
MIGKSVTVVGAGFAGLTAATALRAMGFGVTVLEARADVGGRVWSRTDICNGRVIEAGAELIGANHPMWLSFATRLGLGLSVLTSEDQFAAAKLEIPLKLKGRVLSESEAEKLFTEMDTVLRSISGDAATIDADEPWRSPGARDWDTTSVAQRLGQLGVAPDSLLYALLSADLSNNQTLPMDQQSYLGLLALVRGGQIGDDSMAYWTQTEVYRCAAGNQSLAFALRELLANHGSTVLTSTKVTAIDLTGPAWVTITAGGSTYQSDYAVLATPQPTWADITITPPVPGSYQIATGPAVKYLSPVSSRFWLQPHLAPTSISDDLGMTWEGTDNQMLVIGQGLDLSVFAGGPCAGAARTAPDKRAYFTAGLTSMYPDYAKHAASGFFIDWPAEPTIRCGYSCPSPGQVTTAAPQLARLYQNRLAFAGEHTVMAMFGYMEGALKSGALAADRIKNAAGID